MRDYTIAHWRDQAIVRIVNDMVEEECAREDIGAKVTEYLQGVDDFIKHFDLTLDTKVTWTNIDGSEGGLARLLDDNDL